jgi:predicted nucleotidyltransferase
MEIELPNDFKELLKSLEDNGVQYLVIGGYAVIMHGHPRFTADLDLAVSSDVLNAERLVKVLEDFGFAGPTLKPSLFTNPRSLVRLGVEPVKIEILNYLEGAEFDEALLRAETRHVEDISVSLISLPDLLANKTAVGRPQDLVDVIKLREVNSDQLKTK